MFCMNKNTVQAIQSLFANKIEKKYAVKVFFVDGVIKTNTVRISGLSNFLPCLYVKNDAWPSILKLIDK